MEGTRSARSPPTPTSSPARRCRGSPTRSTASVTSRCATAALSAGRSPIPIRHPTSLRSPSLSTTARSCVRCAASEPSPSTGSSRVRSRRRLPPTSCSSRSDVGRSPLAPKVPTASWNSRPRAIRSWASRPSSPRPADRSATPASGSPGWGRRRTGRRPWRMRLPRATAHRLPSLRPLNTPRTDRSSTATSTPIASTDRGWRSSTPGARSRPRWDGRSPRTRAPASDRVQVLRVTPGRPVPARLVGALLARDLTVAGERWSKGRRLTADDLDAIAKADPGEPVTVLLPDPGEIHEDEAAVRLATAVAGPGVVTRGQAESRLDLVADVDGVLNVRVADLERLNRIDPLEVFTVFDGQVVARADLVGSVKIAPHLVASATVEAGARIGRNGSRPLLWVAPFVPRRVGVIVKESVRGIARERFETSVRAKIEGLASEIVAIDYVEDDAMAVEAAMARFVRGRHRVDLILTAGAASTDPLDACFVGIDALGGRVVRRGVPAHPGSMLWLARIGRTAILGLPTCGAYSKATAADLLLPRLLSGDPPTARTVAKLGHGGILTRSQRFRFPAYARELDAPDG